MNPMAAPAQGLKYDKQLIVTIKTAHDYATVQQACNNLGRKAARAGIECLSVELDPSKQDIGGRMTIPAELNEGIRLLNSGTKSRLYIVTHSSTKQAGLLQGLNAAELVAAFAGLKSVARVTIVACHGAHAANVFASVSFAQQFHTLLKNRGVLTEVACYRTPISVATLEYEEHLKESNPGVGQVAGHKIAHPPQGSPQWVAPNRSNVKVTYYWDGGTQKSKNG